MTPAKTSTRDKHGLMYGLYRIGKMHWIEMGEWRQNDLLEATARTKLGSYGP